MKESRSHGFLKGVLAAQTLGVLAYTMIVIKNDGANFLSRALEFLASLTWMGQFTLDFQCYLILSALWIAWRDKFSVRSIGIAIIAMVLGIIVFAPYLLYLLHKEKASIKAVLIGSR